MDWNFDIVTNMIKTMKHSIEVDNMNDQELADALIEMADMHSTDRTWHLLMEAAYRIDSSLDKRYPD